jgi:hypothetical protein
VFALQDIVKTAKYYKRCFDQIKPTFNENAQKARGRQEGESGAGDISTQHRHLAQPERM